MFSTVTRNIIWNLHTVDPATVTLLKEKLGVTEFLAKLLVAKGLHTPEEATAYIGGGYEQFGDPFLLPDMDKAVARIEKALADHEKILIYGDYDVDGVTASALLLLYLRERGGNADYYIPERISEGYGLNTAAIERFRAGGVTLIITVDSGITASAEVDFASSIGVETVITDHHECREQLPDAVAVVNPHRADSKYPFSELAGVGVVFKLVCALEHGKNVPKLCARYADIAALGTVADVMPIIGENRVLVKFGLDRLDKTANAGLSALIRQSFSEKRSAKARKITTASISFGLAPRINAAGRIGDVNRAVKLLITNDTAEADAIADYLCSVNRERQLIENEIFEQAVEMLEKTVDFDNDKVLILTSDHWHLGVIGIVASKITDRYGLPSILISFDGDVGKGSGRSVKGFNINEALSACKEYLLKYGGHELAAGLTITRENVDIFRQKINEYARSTFDFDNVCTYLNADFEIGGGEVTLENAMEIAKLEPYGLRNDEPLFYLRNVLIKELYPIGEGKHLKLVLEKDGCSFIAVYFAMPLENFPYAEGTVADFLCRIGYNDFRGCRTVQVYVRDVRPIESVLKEREAGEKLFEEIMSGKTPCPKEHLPELVHFRTVFLYLKSLCAGENRTAAFSVFFTAAKISASYRTEITPCMLHIALAVFDEMKLLTLSPVNQDTVSVTLSKSAGKVDLNASEILSQIKQRMKDEV